MTRKKIDRAKGVEANQESPKTAKGEPAGRKGSTPSRVRENLRNGRKTEFMADRADFPYWE